MTISMRAGEPAVDVVVVGGGNAGLCAAMSAVDCGASVLLVERAPAWIRGGNTRHTRNVRNVHSAADAYVTGPYEAEEFHRDLKSVVGDAADTELGRMVVERSRGLTQWMEAHGVAFQRALRGTLHLSHSNHFFLGGGKALVNAYYRTAERSGVRIRYESPVVDLHLENGRAVGVTIERSDGKRSVTTCRAVVVASGGFEANLDWLAEYWGPAARNYAVRGTPYNDGSMLRLLIERGAQTTGDPKGFHAIAVDARGPKFDGGIVTRLDTIPLGIVVNTTAARFYDEGEDTWPKRYAIWGRLIAEQPDQRAYSIIDAKAAGHVIPSVYEALQGSTIEELARLLELDPSALRATVDDFNAHIPAGGDFDPSRLDGNRTVGLALPKSNWARSIDTPPFLAYPLRPGVTFTYLGVAVTPRAEVLRTDGTPFDNVFAAGEIMAGNVLTRGYVGGTGLTIGSVFGRIAGEEAARRAHA